MRVLWKVLKFRIKSIMYKVDVYVVIYGIIVDFKKEVMDWVYFNMGIVCKILKFRVEGVL